MVQEREWVKLLCWWEEEEEEDGMKKKKFKRKYRLRDGRKIKTVPLMINDVRGLYYWGN